MAAIRIAAHAAMKTCHGSSLIGSSSCRKAGEYG
jgi:hypothetical protein